MYILSYILLGILPILLKFGREVGFTLAYPDCCTQFSFAAPQAGSCRTEPAKPTRASRAATGILSPVTFARGDMHRTRCSKLPSTR